LSRRLIHIPPLGGVGEKKEAEELSRCKRRGVTPLIGEFREEGTRMTGAGGQKSLTDFDQKKEKGSKEEDSSEKKRKWGFQNLEGNMYPGSTSEREGLVWNECRIIGIGGKE